MSPGLSKFLYDHMTEDQRDRLAEVVRGLAVVIPKIDAELNQAGQRLADDTEAWLRDGAL